MSLFAHSAPALCMTLETVLGLPGRAFRVHLCPRHVQLTAYIFSPGS